ncbi:hypothetical protein [Nostoc sp. CALU 1950]|uniref:hypothetical protein n=1 Tax=Nostoc sp. CALU 1950 TaxID=3104321 RepID=UPI003EBD6B04
MVTCTKCCLLLSANVSFQDAEFDIYDFKQTYFLLPKEAIAVYNDGTPCLYAASIYLQFLWQPKIRR